jgi:hypothetical protein
MATSDWAWFLIGLAGMGVGAVLMFKPYHLIRFEARFAKGYYSLMAGDDDEQTKKRMWELPWSRYIQNGLTCSDFLKEAEANPRQFTVLSCFIRIMGAGFLFAFGISLFAALILRITGFAH